MKSNATTRRRYSDLGHSTLAFVFWSQTVFVEVPLVGVYMGGSKNLAVPRSLFKEILKVPRSLFKIFFQICG